MRGSPPRLPTGFAVLLGTLLLASSATAVPPGTPAPGEASGTFSIDGKSVALHYAYAMTQPDTFDAKKTNTAILLSEKPLPADALARAKDLEDAGHEQTNWILIRLNEQGSPIREVVRHESLGDASLQMSGMTHSDFKAGTRSADRVEGSIRTEKEEEFLRHKYRTDVRFAALIHQAAREEPPPNARTGKKLPPGGGEPGKAYLAFEDAVRRKDLAAIRKLKPADMPDMSDEDLRQALELMAAMSPAKVAINEGYIHGDDAVLYVSGTQGGRKTYGTILMKRTGGDWLAANQNWSDKPPEK